LIVSVVVACFALLGGSSLARLGDERATLLMPFVQLDGAISTAFNEINNLPATMANFTHSLGAASAAALDQNAVSIANVLPQTLLLVTQRLLEAFFDATNAFVRWVNSQNALFALPRAKTVPPIDEGRLVADILALQLSTSEFRVVRDLFAQVDRANVSALGLPTLTFKSAETVSDIVDACLAVTDRISVALLSIGVVLLTISAIRVAHQFSRPFLRQRRCVVVGKLLAGTIETQNYVPFLCGIALIALGVSLWTGAAAVHSEALRPLAQADVQIRAAINGTNKVIVGVPNLAIDAINGKLREIAATQRIKVVLHSVVTDTFGLMATRIVSALNAFLEQTQLCGARCIAVPRLTEATLDLLAIGVQPLAIPNVRFDTVPEDLVSLERMFAEPLDALRNLILQAAYAMLVLGFICVAVPICVVTSATCELRSFLPSARWRAVLDSSDLDGQHQHDQKGRGVGKLTAIGTGFQSSRTMRFDDDQLDSPRQLELTET
jgi:hypothetical protein